ncbi:MAG: hypothetical protein AAGD01_08525 [Acidobacteriota bacterium]
MFQNWKLLTACLGLATLLLLTPLVFAEEAVDFGQVPSKSGLFFNIQNSCPTAANGFAVGDELCLLKVGTADFLRNVFQGDLSSGETKQVATCANSFGNGVVLFIPPLSSNAEAVRVTVVPNSTVQVPSSFCGTSEAETSREQLKRN